MSCKVIVCDAGPPRHLVIGDVGCYQGAGVEAYVPYRMPAAKIENNTFSMTYINFYLYMLVFLYKQVLKMSKFGF